MSILQKKTKVSNAKDLLKVVNSGKCLPSIINDGTLFRGTVESRDSLEISGYFEGEISGNMVYLRSTSNVKGVISANYLRIEGSFNGTIRSASIFLSETSLFEGEMHYGIMSVEEGSVISGDLKHDPSLLEIATIEKRVNTDSGDDKNEDSNIRSQAQ